MAKGLIISSIGQIYYVKELQSKNIFEGEEFYYKTKPRGIFRKEKITPLVGDIVEFRVNDEQILVIDKIYERKNVLIRPNVANIDQLIIVMAIKQPKTDFLMIDKFLVLAQKLKIDVVICVNKTDLSETFEDNMNEYLEIKERFLYYEKIGYKVIYISAEYGENIEKLACLLENKISALAGLSGVGKSTIINSLVKEDYVKVGQLSSKVDKGKHTTRMINLFKSYGGYVADTPGFCKIEIDEIESEELKNYYPEFIQNKDICKYSECNHISEPDCKIKLLVEQNEINLDRYEKYKYLFEKLKSNKKWR